MSRGHLRSGLFAKGKNKDSSRVSKNVLSPCERSGNLRKTVSDKSDYYSQTRKGPSVLVGIWGLWTSVLSARVTSKSCFGENAKSSRRQYTLGYPNPNKVILTYKSEPNRTKFWLSALCYKKTQPSDKTTHPQIWDRESIHQRVLHTGRNTKSLRDILGF